MACENNPLTCPCFYHVIERDLSPCRPAPKAAAVKVTITSKQRMRLIKARHKALKKGR
jgi:hypothetical protein